MRRFLIIGLLLVIAGVVYLVATSGMNVSPSTDENIRFGYIKSVSTNGNYGVAFDEAEWLTEEEGENAAIEAGLCTDATRDECLPNDFYIRNKTVAIENLEFATTVEIAMFTLNMEEEGVKETLISKQEFEKLINDPTTHWRQIPFQILVRDGLIRIVEEVYVP